MATAAVHETEATRRMKRVVGGAVVLVLACCGSPSEPNDGQPRPPSTTESAAQATEADFGAVCDALEDTVELPADGIVRYTSRYNEPTGWATNAPICDIEPDGEYYDVAATAPAFGRAEFNYGVLTETQIEQLRYPTYAPEMAQELLTLDQADPLSEEVPCASEPCEDGVHGYQYNFRFETVMDDIAVVAQFDYITTDVGVDEQLHYRTQAIEAFIASMNVIADEFRGAG